MIAMVIIEMYILIPLVLLIFCTKLLYFSLQIYNMKNMFQVIMLK